MTGPVKHFTKFVPFYIALVLLAVYYAGMTVIHSIDWMNYIFGGILVEAALFIVLTLDLFIIFQHRAFKRLRAESGLMTFLLSPITIVITLFVILAIETYVMNVLRIVGHARINMSLHFQLDIAFDLKKDCPAEVTAGLKNLCDKKSLGEEQAKHIPRILAEEVLRAEQNLSFTGRDVFYFRQHYRYTKNGTDIHRWTLHFRTMLSDDVFYEEGYTLLAWFASVAGTTGFVGYVKEELEQFPRLVYFEQGDVRMQQEGKEEVKFRLSDFS